MSTTIRNDIQARVIHGTSNYRIVRWTGTRFIYLGRIVPNGSRLQYQPKGSKPIGAVHWSVEQVLDEHFPQHDPFKSSEDVIKIQMAPGMVCSNKLTVATPEIGSDLTGHDYFAVMKFEMLSDRSKVWNVEITGRPLSPQRILFACTERVTAEQLVELVNSGTVNCEIDGGVA
jgi:hypothetical protein